MRTEEDYRKALEAAVAAVHKEEGKGRVFVDSYAKERIEWHIDIKPNAPQLTPNERLGFWKWAATVEYGLPLLRKLRYIDAEREHEQRAAESSKTSH